MTILQDGIYSTIFIFYFFITRKTNICLIYAWIWMTSWNYFKYFFFVFILPFFEIFPVAFRVIPVLRLCAFSNQMIASFFSGASGIYCDWHRRASHQNKFFLYRTCGLIFFLILLIFCKIIPVYLRIVILTHGRLITICYFKVYMTNIIALTGPPVYTITIGDLALWFLCYYRHIVHRRHGNTKIDWQSSKGTQKMQNFTRNPLVGSVLREFERKLNKIHFCHFILRKISPNIKKMSQNFKIS